MAPSSLSLSLRLISAPPLFLATRPLALSHLCCPTSLLLPVFQSSSSFFAAYFLFMIQSNHPFYLHTLLPISTPLTGTESQIIVSLKPGSAVVTAVISPYLLSSIKGTPHERHLGPASTRLWRSGTACSLSRSWSRSPPPLGARSPSPRAPSI